ncbi:MAG: type II toxin-antitoxin system RelE/ParE family toxin [Blastomonas sp.]|jgi:putative addiction module killer protein|nr:type II toxin-antitoxin system RelE/ParE family toxin [Blastomonas sp.]
MTKPDDGSIDKTLSVLYKGQVFEVAAHRKVIEWLIHLKDARGRAKLIDRFDRLSDGNKGDWKSVGGGVFELRSDAYRVYFVQQGGRLIILLLGGDKSSQKRDIPQAKRMAMELKQDGGHNPL